MVAQGSVREPSAGGEDVWLGAPHGLGFLSPGEKRRASEESQRWETSCIHTQILRELEFRSLIARKVSYK